MKVQLITAMVLTSIVAGSASAGPLENAWVRQQVSISRGMADGSLTPREVIRLERQAISIADEAAYLRWTGGHLGPYERAYLGARLIGARALIYRYRHN
jgi:hypothetical protein